MSSSSQLRPSAPRPWHLTATIYELYPSSFKSSTSTPTGDIRGIISQIPYLSSLGITAIWLAACHKSSGIDNGYDVVDYRSLDAQYGTVEDLEELIRELRKVGIGLIMDMVVNHTSDQHPWFVESRRSSSRQGNPKREWYIWRPSSSTRIIAHQDGNPEILRLPPNNWASIFGGSAWTFDEQSEEWYLHIFSSGQPDLNWNCKEVREAVYEDMRFWLEKGVAGFRLDVVNLISKPDGLAGLDVRRHEDEKLSKSVPRPAYEFYCNGPRVHEFLREMRREVLEPFNEGLDESGKRKILLGEVIVTSDPEAVRSYILPERQELDMLYQYDIFDLDSGPNGKFSSPDPPLTQKQLMHKLKRTLAHWQTELSYSATNDACGTTWLESHDTARSVSRFGGDMLNSSDWNRRKFRSKVAKMLAMLECTLGGSLFIYQGQEIGMMNLHRDIAIEEYQDVEAKKAWDEEFARRCKAAGTDTNDKSFEADMSDFEDQLRLKARDHARMPLPWQAASDREPHAGFSDASKKTKMWSPMNTDSVECNIVDQEKDAESVLNFWRRMIRFRQQRTEPIVLGNFQVVESTVEDESCPVFAYWRRAAADVTAECGQPEGERNLLVVINMTAEEDVPFELPIGAHPRGSEARFAVVAATDDRKWSGSGSVLRGGDEVSLDAFDGVVFAIQMM